jgi:hypothetical protein
MPPTIIKNLKILSWIKIRTGLEFCTMFRYCISQVSPEQHAMLAELGFELVPLAGLSYPFIARLDSYGEM